MLSLGGTALNTVAGFQIEIQITVPSRASQSEIGIFDGDFDFGPARNSSGFLIGTLSRAALEPCLGAQ